MSHLPYQMLAKKAMSVAQSKVCNFPPCIVWVCTSSTGGLLISTTLLNQPSFFICIIISFRPAWLARALLSFKRAQSSGNDNADEGQHVLFGAPVISRFHSVV